MLLLSLHTFSIWPLTCADQRAVGQHVLAPQAPRQRVTLAAGAECDRVGSSVLSCVGLQSRVDEVGAGALEVLGVRAAQCRGRTEVAQLAGTQGCRVVSSLRREQRALRWYLMRVVIVVMVMMVLLRL